VRVQTYFLSSGVNVLRAIAALKQLTFGPKRGYVITIEPVEPHHTDAQRKKLRAMEGEIAEHTGNDPDELHEILLARRFGIEEVNLGNGKVLHRPARRSSDLSRSEMGDFITWVQAFAAREAGLELA
jgi:hypothetical protein